MIEDGDRQWVLKWWKASTFAYPLMAQAVTWEPVRVDISMYVLNKGNKNTKERMKLNDSSMGRGL